MRLVICDTVDNVAEWSAKYVLKRIHDFQPNENKYFVLGLPTGMFSLLIITCSNNFNTTNKIIIVTI